MILLIRVISLVFLFLVRCRFPTQFSIISILRKRYGENLVKSVRKLEKLDFKHKKKFCLSLHYIGANSYLFVHGTEIYKFKAKDSEIRSSPLCLGNNSKDW